MRWLVGKPGRSIGALALLAVLSACGGGGGNGADAGAGGGPVQPTPPPANPQPPNPPTNPPPGPAPDPLAAGIADAAAAIRADACTSAASCSWTEQPYRPEEFVMPQGSGEALLVIDNFPTLPVRAIRYRKRIKAYYRSVAGGLEAASATWRVPATLWNVLDRFATSTYVAAHRLREVGRAASARYDSLQLDNAGHGSYVFSLLADANPQQPLVVMGALELHRMNRADFCDTSGAPEVAARLLRTAQAAAGQLKEVIRVQNVRFINYSAGHSLPQTREGWPGACGSAVPPDEILRAKLAAYAPLYAVLFGTPGVMTAHASAQAGNAADFPYDAASPAYPNRLRVGYFTTLDSQLDAQGRGNASFEAWPAAGQADIYLNTGVLPQRPYEFNRTPLLQLDNYGLDTVPITGPQPSWVAPLALARMINVRHGVFGARQMDDALVAEVFGAMTPAGCPAQAQGRCRYQDPLLHGQIEAIRLEYRPLQYTP